MSTRLSTRVYCIYMLGTCRSSKLPATSFLTKTSPGYVSAQTARSGLDAYVRTVGNYQHDCHCQLRVSTQTKNVWIICSQYVGIIIFCPFFPLNSSILAYDPIWSLGHQLFCQHMVGKITNCRPGTKHPVGLILPMTWFGHEDPSCDKSWPADCRPFV